MNWSERGLLALQRGVGKTVVYNPNEAKIMASVKDYGSAVATALKPQDSAALARATAEVDSWDLGTLSSMSGTRQQLIMEQAKRFQTQ
jgi:hypothetical protein